MKIRAIGAMVGLVLLAAAATRADEIRWETDLARAVAASRRAERPLLVLVTSPHCGYCTKLKQETLRRPVIQEQVCRDFIPATFDGTENPALAKRLGVRAFPTLVVITPDKFITARIEGFIGPEALVRHLEVAQLPLQLAERPAGTLAR